MAYYWDTTVLATETRPYCWLRHDRITDWDTALLLTETRPYCWLRHGCITDWDTTVLLTETRPYCWLRHGLITDWDTDLLPTESRPYYLVRNGLLLTETLLYCWLRHGLISDWHTVLLLTETQAYWWLKTVLSRRAIWLLLLRGGCDFNIHSRLALGCSSLIWKRRLVSFLLTGGRQRWHSVEVPIARHWDHHDQTNDGSSRHLQHVHRSREFLQIFRGTMNSRNKWALKPVWIKLARFQIPFIRRFPVKHHISCLAWNPQVGLKCSLLTRQDQFWRE